MNIENFCKEYNLGTVKNITKLTGGLMHKMFKVETNECDYAIKVLNPEVMKKEGAYDSFVTSETISNLAKENGIPVSSALSINGSYLTKFDDQYYMVYDFINGKVLNDDEITVEHCKKIGKILSQLHTLPYQDLGLVNKRVNYSRLYDWESYTKNSNFDNMSYKNNYLKNYKKYNSLLKRANERFNESNIAVSLCHNDMDPRNVLWVNNNPVIIDWESSGLSNPYREMIEDALCWSGFLSNNFDEEKFTALISEYIKVNKLEHKRYGVICGNLVGRLGWLKYNIERSLGISSNDLEERKLAEKEVNKTIDEINRYVELIGTMYEIICKLTKESNHKYDKVIESIINNNDLLKGKEYKLITAGFTNTIYQVDNYVVRICTNTSNENNFNKEIEFYKNNSNNKHIPKMYYSDISKEFVPYYYQILELIEGKTLYEIWYKLSDSEKHDMVKNIINVLKSIHSIEVEKIDFKGYIKDRLMSLLDESNINNEAFDKLLNKCDIYFKENKLGFLHNDLHFDNFIYHEGTLTLLDFERSIIGSIDYDFKIFEKCKKTPWLWANEKTDMLAVESDYQNLMNMIIDNYEELRSIPYLKERLEVYEIIDLLDSYKKNQDEYLLEEITNKTNNLLKNTER